MSLIKHTTCIRTALSPCNVRSLDNQVYRFAVPEDAPPRTLVGQIVATDLDSGRFGQVEYALRGFGADRFDVDPITGEITVKVGLCNLVVMHLK